jgi:hypothetical protein
MSSSRNRSRRSVGNAHRGHVVFYFILTDVVFRFVDREQISGPQNDQISHFFGVVRRFLRLAQEMPLGLGIWIVPAFLSRQV